MSIMKSSLIALLLAMPAALLADDVIRSGCSGGFTGGGSGYEIHRDGSIRSWRKDSWNSSPDTTLIRSDKAAAGRLFALFGEAGFFRMNLHEPGNMTCFLTLELEGKSHEVSWSNEPPQPVRELNDAVTTLVTGEQHPSPGEVTTIQPVPAPAPELTIIQSVPAPAPKLKPKEKYPAPKDGP